MGEIEVLGLLKHFLEFGNKPFEQTKVKDHMKADFVENSSQQIIHGKRTEVSQWKTQSSGQVFCPECGKSLLGKLK